MNPPPDKQQKLLEIKKEWLKTISHAEPLKEKDHETVDIEAELAKREAITNLGLKQDIQLKKITLLLLFLFLILETIAVFVFAYLQGVGLNGFRMEEWSFKLLLGATILQITYMLQMAVKHLFPNKEDIKAKIK